MLNQEECNALLRFLDRTPLTGHGERQAMNVLVQKLGQMSLAFNKPESESEEEFSAKEPAKDKENVA